MPRMNVQASLVLVKNTATQRYKLALLPYGEELVPQSPGAWPDILDETALTVQVNLGASALGTVFVNAVRVLYEKHPQVIARCNLGLTDFVLGRYRIEETQPGASISLIALNSEDPDSPEQVLLVAGGKDAAGHYAAAFPLSYVLTQMVVIPLGQCAGADLLQSAIAALSDGDDAYEELLRVLVLVRDFVRAQT